MAVLDHTSFASARQPSILSIAAYRVVDLVEQGTHALHRYIVRSQTERALRQLSDRQLADIGIERADITKISTQMATKFSG